MHIKFKKARVKALLATIDELDSKLSTTEEDGLENRAIPTASADHISISNAGRTPPCKTIVPFTNFAPSSLVTTACRRMGEDPHSSVAESGSGDFRKSLSHNDLLNDILCWDSYREFMSFCKNIGIQLRDCEEAKGFLDTARAQHGLPTRPPHTLTLTRVVQNSL